MKRISFLSALIVFMLLFAACDEIFKGIDIEFESDHYSAEFEVYPSDSGSNLELRAHISGNIKSEINDNGGDLDYLESITVSNLTIETVSGASNFNAFGPFSVNIESDSIDNVQISWMDTIPYDTSIVFPNTTSDNLMEYIKGDEYDIIFMGILRSDITDTVLLKADINYQVIL